MEMPESMNNRLRSNSVCALDYARTHICDRHRSLLHATPLLYAKGLYYTLRLKCRIVLASWS
jgi:hypothetical protein